VIPAEIVETQTDQSPKNILVVDDDKLFLEMAAQMCRQLGHNVEACDNYDSFEKMLLHIDDYDLVLSDMEMGDFSGEDLLRKVKQHRKDLAVIVMTGRNKLVPEEFKAKGFSGCLQKPFTSENLFYLIGGTLSSPSLEKDSQRVDRTDEQLFYEQFISEMVKNIVWLRKTSADKDFPKARYICHKILPIVSHLNAPEKITDALRKIDEMGTREVMPETGIWDKIASLADQLELFLEKIQDKYFPD
jgi:CheY-like chemotaxis protein